MRYSFMINEEGSTKYIRILSLYGRFLNGEVINKAKEAKAFEVAGRTIQRDIDDLRYFFENHQGFGVAGGSISYHSKLSGYFLKRDKDDAPLTKGQVLAVCKILIGSRAFTKDVLEAIVNKLIGSCVAGENKKLANQLISNEKFHYVEPQHKTNFIESLWEIGIAIKEQRRMQINYREIKNMDVVQRIVEPVGIMFSEFYFYMIAFILDKPQDYPVIYRIDGIEGFKILNEHFRVPYTNRFEEGEFRKRVQFMYGGELQNITIRYSGNSIEEVLDRLPTAEILEKNDDGFIISAEVFGKIGIEKWIRSQGDHVEVLNHFGTYKDKIGRAIVEEYAIKNISLKDEINKKITSEKEIKKLNWELKLEVAERNLQLEAINYELTKTNETLEKGIVERQKIEQEISKLNALFTSILESSPEIIVFALDCNYRYLTFNKKHKDTMLQIWGKNIEIGMNMLEVIGNQSDKDRAKSNFDRVLQGESFTSNEEYGDENLLRLSWRNHWSTLYDTVGNTIGITCFVVNITKQKQAQKALKGSESSLKEAQRIAHIGSYSTDFITGMWTSSTELDRIFAIDQDYDRSIEGWFPIIHPDWRNKLKEYLIKIREEKQCFDYIYKIIGINDKKERWIHGLGELEFDQQNNVIGLIGTIQDITEQKIIEDELEMSEENLKNTLQSIGAGVITTDLEQKVLILNHIAERLTGWTQQEAEGKFFRDIFNICTEEESQNIKDPVQEVLETNQIIELENYEILISRDGIRRNVARSAAPIKDTDGNTKGVVMVFRDVTEQQEMQQRLEKYKILVENANDAMLFIDKMGNILETNDTATKTFGYTYNEFRSMNVIDLINTKQQAYITKQIEMAKEKPIVFETIHYRKDGTSIPVEVSLQSTFLSDKRIILGILRDITEQKNKEKEIHYLSYHDQLTGLYNRRFFEEEWRRLDTERNLPMTLVMTDVNGLKLTNDAFGHKAGDLLLEKLANIIKKQCRSDELIARIGGDEFVLLLPRTNEKEAEVIVRRISAAIEKENIDTATLWVSMGFAVKQAIEEDLNQIFKRAEDSMHEHKLSQDYIKLDLKRQKN